MKKISVCVGSSCHLKGSHEIISTLQEIIERKNLGKKINLVGNFCLDCCSEGANILVEGKIYSGVTPEELEGIIEELEGREK